RRDPAAALRRRRASRPRADARSVALPGPAVQRCVRGRIHQRARALRPDVPLRLLFPGAAGTVADHGRPRARAARDRDARIVAAAVPQDVLFKIFSGLTSGLSTAQLDPFISNMHLALWVLAVISLVGAAVSMLLPAHVRTTEREPVLEAVA